MRFEGYWVYQLLGESMDCLFCKIIDKSIESKIVYEDEHVIAFHDINPKAPIHILIIPKKHIATVNEVEINDTSLMGHIIHTAKEIAQTEGINDEGYRLIFNVNPAGGQEVYHIHLHLLGGRQMTWPPG